MGSFWYISSIQRLMACWKQYNCGIGNEKICQIGTLFCDNPASTNFTSLKFSCHPSNLPDTNATHFDYGIFLDLIQSKLVGKPNLKWPPQKLVYCFWWGLQNIRYSVINDFLRKLLLAHSNVLLIHYSLSLGCVINISHFYSSRVINV